MYFSFRNHALLCEPYRSSTSLPDKLYTVCTISIHNYILYCKTSPCVTAIIFSQQPGYFPAYHPYIYSATASVQYSVMQKRHRSATSMPFCIKESVYKLETIPWIRVDIRFSDFLDIHRRGYSAAEPFRSTQVPAANTGTTTAMSLLRRCIGFPMPCGPCALSGCPPPLWIGRFSSVGFLKPAPSGMLRTGYYPNQRSLRLCYR